MTGPVGFWYVKDIKKSVQSLVEAGAQIQEAAKDVGGGRMTATVKDADGNVTGLDT